MSESRSRCVCLYYYTKCECKKPSVFKDAPPKNYDLGKGDKTVVWNTKTKEEVTVQGLLEDNARLTKEIERLKGQLLGSAIISSSRDKLKAELAKAQAEIQKLKDDHSWEIKIHKKEIETLKQKLGAGCG